MKTALFAGVAMALMAGSMCAAAPAAAPQAEHAQTPIPFAQVKAVADKWWDRMDANHDGRIDRADRDARLLRRFDAWDTNHDGVISKDEFLTFVHARQAQWSDDRHPDDRHPGDHPGGPEGMAPRGHGDADHAEATHGPDRFIARAIVGPAFGEARKDGVITRAAFDAAVRARFDALDANHDGALTGEELRGAWHRGGHHDWHHRDGQSPPPPPAPAH